MRREFPSGEKIIVQGETVDTVHILRRGNVKVSVRRLDGSEALVALRGAGEALGEFSALSGLARTATVRASGPCTTFVLSGERFRALVKAIGLERVLWRHIVRRQQESESLRAEMVTLTPRQRLAETMIRLSTPTGEDAPAGATGANGTTARRSGRVRELRLSRRELGDAIGRSRSWIQDELRQLRAEGVIDTRRQLVLINDVERLRGLADADADSESGTEG